jgi:hypothetical protein
MGRSTSAVRRDRDRLLGAVNKACRLLVDVEAAARDNNGGVLPVSIVVSDRTFHELVNDLDNARRAVTGVIFAPRTLGQGGE